MTDTNTLKEQSMSIIINQIISLPPLLKEELLDISLDRIKNDLRKEIKSELKQEILGKMENVVSDMTSLFLTSSSDVKRPAYTKNMDDDIYQTCVNISHNNIAIISEKIEQEYNNIIIAESDNE